MNRAKIAKRTKDYVYAAFLLFLSFVMLIPFLWMFSTSFRPPSESYKLPPSFIPTSFEIHNYEAVLFSSIPFFRMLWNSVLVAVVVTIAQLITCSMAAYAFARLHFRGKGLIFAILMSTLMVPSQVTIIPTFIALSKIRLTDTLFSLILPYITSVFGVFLLRQFFLSLPKELEESGMIDGANYRQIFVRLIMPQCGSAMAALCVLQFLNSWNNYFTPLIFIRTWEKMTLPLGIASLQGYMGSGNLSEIMAGVTLAMLPMMVIFLFAQRYFIEGIAMSGIKD
ncbi:ABC transporter permease subunit [Beduinella massiliensis]|uniref:ABC transporter permease subunit n=1 Tax=Beduinella massiliensis TaxID=1852363 RepID=UPI000C81CFDD